MQIPFRKNHTTHQEVEYLKQVFKKGRFSGGGSFTLACEQVLKKRYNFTNGFLTSSCTHALELAAYLCDISAGDEVIIPAYTYVSTANAFVKQGAIPVFADSLSHHPNIDLDKVEALISDKTKAIVVVHYGGFACDMEKAVQLAKKHNLFLIEDAAHAIDSFYEETPLGSFADFSTFSFHDTKNITAGEAGFLVIRDSEMLTKAINYRDKGTNQAAFTAGTKQYYEWVSQGSSCKPSELNAACLLGQLEALTFIQQERKRVWDYYFKKLKPFENTHPLQIPRVENYMQHNASIFYIVCATQSVREALISYMASKGMELTFHYYALHQSEFYKQHYPSTSLNNASHFTNTLARLPIYPALTTENQELIIEHLIAFFEDYK